MHKLLGNAQDFRLTMAFLKFQVSCDVTLSYSWSGYQQSEVSRQSQYQNSPWNAWPWRWQHRSPSKYHKLLTQWHTIISQKTWSSWYCAGECYRNSIPSQQLPVKPPKPPQFRIAGFLDFLHHLTFTKKIQYIRKWIWYCSQLKCGEPTTQFCPLKG